MSGIISPPSGSKRKNSLFDLIVYRLGGRVRKPTKTKAKKTKTKRKK